MKCNMMACHQLKSAKKTCTEKYISQLKCSRISFFKIYIVPYAFTGCNLRVGIRRYPKAFYKGHTLEGGWQIVPLFGARGLALLRKMVVEHFTGLN